MLAMIVEPTRLYRAMLSSMLESIGVSVVAISQGQEAIQQLENKSFDLLCTSMHLSDMSGIDLANELRKHKCYSSLPIVLLTSEDDKTIHSRALDAGITDIYHKNDTDQLARYIRYQANLDSSNEKMAGRVLFVEDSRSIALLITGYLIEMGLQVDHFERAEEAIKAYGKTEYDLVITDFLLEGKMAGSGLLREVRSLPAEKARVPVLVISSFSDNSRKLELLKNGANDYVAKPIFPEELQLRVRNLINSKQLVDRLEQQQDVLTRLAMTDQLTSLYNRHYLFDVVPKKISEARRHGQNFCMAIVDLDHFKSINDNHGHAAGDVVLRAVGTMLREHMRNEDVVARFGGEEFIVLLSNCDLQHAAIKVEALRASIEALKSAGLRVTASFGIAQFIPEKHEDFTQIFTDADKALYIAKESGRNCIKLASPDIQGVEITH